MNETESRSKIERLRAAVRAVRELHRPYLIFGDDCDHAIYQDPLDAPVTADGTHHFIGGIGWTCDLTGVICRHCCTDDGEHQSEDCAAGHDHRPGLPVCATVAALDAQLSTE